MSLERAAGGWGGEESEQVGAVKLRTMRREENRDLCRSFESIGPLSPPSLPPNHRRPHVLLSPFLNILAVSLTDTVHFSNNLITKTRFYCETTLVSTG